MGRASRSQQTEETILTRTTEIHTRRGRIRFPAYVPVTTFGDAYPLDDLVRPYLPRLAPAMMVSYHYARQMKEDSRLPLMVDSGGFASLFANAHVVMQDGLGILQIQREEDVETVSPREVLELQERIADIAFTLDFPIPPGTEATEALRRQQLTIANAHWALRNRRRRDLLLYAVVQAWDAESARGCARSYAGAGFDGVAIGGLVPRSRDTELVTRIIEAVQEEVSGLPIHVFGLGKPETIARLFEAGVDSVDSSAYVQMAAEGRLWSNPDRILADPAPTDRLHIALCNLALATSKTLPLSMAPLLFQTYGLS